MSDSDFNFVFILPFGILTLIVLIACWLFWRYCYHPDCCLRSDDQSHVTRNIRNIESGNPERDHYFVQNDEDHLIPRQVQHDRFSPSVSQSSRYLPGTAASSRPRSQFSQASRGHQSPTTVRPRSPLRQLSVKELMSRQNQRLHLQPTFPNFQSHQNGNIYNHDLLRNGQSSARPSVLRRSKMKPQTTQDRLRFQVTPQLQLPNQDQNVPPSKTQNKRISKRTRQKPQKNKKRFIPPQQPLQIKNYLLIAVDATPKFIGGYCINPFEKKVEYYSLSSEDMPWTLNDKSKLGDPAEFEMKNLLCALLLWQQLIIEHKRVKIYTDNWAVNVRRKKAMNEYGQRVQNFIQHLRNCGGVVQLNSKEMHVNQKVNLELFQEIITPADHLSRRRHLDFFECIEKSKWKDFETSLANDGLIFTNTEKWIRNSCDDCGFRVNRTDSLRSHLKFC